MPNTAEIELSQEVSRRLDRHVPTVAAEVTPLLGFAAFHLGAARVASGMAAWLERPGGYDEMCKYLADETFDVLELAALLDSARSTVAALDLCAAALYRFGGGIPRPDREADVGYWDMPSKVANISLPQSLDQWIDALRHSADWRALQDCRDQATHRRFVRRITLNLPGERQPNTQVAYGGTTRPINQLAKDFAHYGETQFADLCDRLMREYP